MVFGLIKNTVQYNTHRIFNVNYITTLYRVCSAPTHYKHRALNLNGLIQLGTSMEKQIIEKGSYLGSLRSPAKYASVPNICRGTKILGNSLDLLSQFSRGSKNQSNGAFTTSQSFLVVNVNGSRKYILQIQPCQNETQICHTKELSECSFSLCIYCTV